MPQGSQDIPATRGTQTTSFQRELQALRRRLMREASVAIGMLESALSALWSLDELKAEDVRARDDRVDREEVAIEAECLRLLALQNPVAADLRQIAFCIKVNADIERVADHATSVAKLSLRIDPPTPRWPTALVELGERVPLMCYDLLRAVLAEDADAAREIVRRDKQIDRLDDRLFEEILERLDQDPERASDLLMMYRIGRELERIGDLMGNIAEDVVFLVTGEIIRHEKKFKRRDEVDTLGG